MPQVIDDYLETVRLGQTERGSYVVTLLSPVDPALPHAFVAAHYSWAYCAQQFVQAMQATKPPLRGGFFARLLYDYALSFPRRVIANIPGLGLMQWGGRKLLRAGYRAWDKHRQPPPDDFA